MSSVSYEEGQMGKSGLPCDCWFKLSLSEPGQAAYASSKAGVAGLALPMARDLARYGIRVVAVAPSLFETAMGANTSEK